MLNVLKEIGLLFSLFAIVGVPAALLIHDPAARTLICVVGGAASGLIVKHVARRRGWQRQW